MKVTEEIIDYVAALAKLELGNEEREQARKDLEDILGYMDIMNACDTSRLEPMSHAFSVVNVFREDVVTNEENKEVLLSNAPVQKEGCFLVPKTVE